MSFVEFIITVK